MKINGKKLPYSDSSSGYFTLDLEVLGLNPNFPTGVLSDKNESRT